MVEVLLQRLDIGPQLVDLDQVTLHRVSGEAVHEAARLLAPRRLLDRR